MEEQAPAWERSKENAAPLERGRNVKALERSLMMEETPEEREEKERMIRHYDRLVQPSEQEDSTDDGDDDPLIHWLSYIKFHQEAFPADTHAQFLLMERCTRALVRRKQYANDVRFIRVCVTYADKTTFPGDVFKYLHQQKVGTYTALFWVAWAWVAENKGDYPFAEKVFLKGISKEAQPLSMLQQRHKQFQRRMSRNWLNTAVDQQQGDDEQAESRRGALGALSDDAVRLNDRRANHGGSLHRSVHSSTMSTFSDRNGTTSRSSAPVDNGAAPKGGFQIFVDENAENHAGYNLDQSNIHHEPRELEREEERKKENLAAAERWNERGALSSSSRQYAVPTRVPAAGAPAFDVFVDEECAAKLEREKEEKKKMMDAARSVRDERTLRQRTDEGVAEKLARDPMRYVRNPSKLESDQVHSADHPNEDSNPKPTEETRKPEKGGSLACGFSKRLVAKDSSGQEQCFEEGRAKARCFSLVNAGRNFNLLATRQYSETGTDGSTMDVDEEESFEIVEGDSSVKERKRPHSSSSSGIPPMPKSLPKKVLFGADTSMDSHNQSLRLNTSTASSTVNERDAVGAATDRDEETINTKLAMKELSMMFSSPAMGLHDTAEPARKSRRSSETGEAIHGNDDGDTATFSLVAGLVDGGTPSANDNSFLAQRDENDENVSPQNPSARSNTTPGFDACALRTMDEVPVAGRALGERQVATGADFEIFCDDEMVEEIPGNGARNAGPPSNADPLFEIYQDESDREQDDKRDSGADTATFSLVGEALKSLNVESAAPKAQQATKSPGGFSIYVDDDSIGDLKNFDTDKVLMDAPEFGDISRIVPDEGDTTSAVRHNLRSPSVVKTPSDSIEYTMLHKHCVRTALRRLQREARELALNDSTASRDPDLSFMLSNKGCIYDMPTQSLPRALQKKTSTQGSEISLGDKTGVVKEELGRGAYGVVVLMDTLLKSDSPSFIAVKAQAPTDCLALEYVILKKIEERVGSHWDSTQEMRTPFPFPRALSFVSLADGGMLGMTAGSKSGLNLVDIANVYQIVERSPVPELIALHYTARMLMHLEALHWHGRILHCDVKPDNWVLTASATSFDSCREVIEASDIMLVDFGRAIDLITAAKGQVDPMDVKLYGDASAEDMACVAMRKGLGWSFDADTYGLCASAHVLLYGTHLDIEEDPSTRRWKPKKPLRRYWQKEMWTELFDTLLNLDDVTGNAIGSRSRSLRSLRNMVEDHLRDRSRELESLLRHQARILPATRPKKG